MAQLVPYGNTETQFEDAGAEFTVTAGAPKTLHIKGNATGGIPSGVKFELARKVAAGHYTVIRTLDATNIYQEGNVTGNGTYASRRLAGDVSAGMDAE